MDAYERLDYCLERKQFGTELYSRGRYVRAMRRYKKTMLDLEVPCAWDNEQHNIERNQMRKQLHLNVAACALKMDTSKQYPTLSTPKYQWDPHLAAIEHCGRVLALEPRNVKALFRRAQLHLHLPPERHINGLALAKADLQLALEIDPNEAAVRKELARAKSIQKAADAKAGSMFARMIEAGEGAKPPAPGSK